MSANILLMNLHLYIDKKQKYETSNFNCTLISWYGYRNKKKFSTSCKFHEEGFYFCIHTNLKDML